MRMYDIIQKKRDGNPLYKKEIDFFINGFTAGKIPDYQASSLLMAIYLQGMDDEEAYYLTMAMCHSGDIVHFEGINGIIADKHSTGGVGDKISLILVPLMACFGIKMPKMSGKGLGHTGGTIDKLESIPGFQTDIPYNQFLNIVRHTGMAIIGQSGNLAPADKKLYALRDVTATVDSIPLIASSIMSKKLAVETDIIVLDVKCGNGAFMRNMEDAKKLSRLMVEIGAKANRKVSAVITGMEEPLGMTIGNSLEVMEAIEVLKGNQIHDILEVTNAIGTCILKSAGVVRTQQEANEKMKKKLSTGEALQKFSEFIANQGGNPEIINDASLLKQPKYHKDLLSKQSGYLTEILCENIGKASVMLGSGRETLTDTIDSSAGIKLYKKVGDYVKTGEPLLAVYTDKDEIDEIVQYIYQCFSFSENMPTPEKLVKCVINSPE